MLVLLAASTLAPVAPADPPRAILEQAVEAMGGTRWLTPKGLKLEGSATFFAPDRAEPRSVADRYVMWRGINPGRTSAHGADGTVRISASAAGKSLFEVGFDGTSTWTEKGIMPRAAADAYWASNMGFGIVRQALGAGFKIERAPDRSVDGHPLAMLRIVDGQGAATLFGIDRGSRLIRYMGFRTPRGFHERTYDDFLRSPGWVQARRVTLTYDGVKQNEVRWAKVTVDPPLDPALFAPPAGLEEMK